ncbi:MAG: hypothetical protein PHI37_02670 [Candidatus Gracilibacteria bacterium]|nr:hypothetical protein [Candidatus Gracilibacteria bacterium]
MKKLLLTFVLFFVLFGANTYAMHPSWDTNFDGLNDCENDGTCDDSVDYTSAKIYKTSNDFLSAEGNMCLSATDGCNNVMIIDGQLGPMTKMYCEDIYGSKGQEKWSCNSYDTEKVDYMKYITKNISNLTEKKPVLGGTWYVVDINWISDENIIVSFEDGHIQEKVTLKKSDIVLEKPEDMRVCTMQYAPVCAEVQVQCIKAPCFPIQETFGNSCMAGKNPVLYNGECRDNVDISLFKRYQKYENYYISTLKDIKTETLQNGLVKADEMIEKTKLMRFAQGFLEKYVTKIVFVKELFVKEINNRY